MDPIEGINLGELLSETSKNVLEDKKREASNTIKKLIYAVEDLDGRIRVSKQKVTELEAEKAKKVALMEKIKNGDWSVLRVEKEQPKPEDKKE